MSYSNCIEEDKVISHTYPEYGVGIVRMVYPDGSILVYWPTLKKKLPKGYCIFRYYPKELEDFEKSS
jgi:hypothetical protein